ncbi:MAG TPA: hypothetical protein PK054_12375 [Anaerohalosphaeraceae bacterium]|nr:hypothetical protein [Anaerohalosphaeraceae bacterium]HOL88982.1 hypothetical protein [Anaerohalosphaeraceae bacterium]HPP57361.1 hypothetical protein [Anaerohalosphaeraceae bacterium]
MKRWIVIGFFLTGLTYQVFANPIIVVDPLSSFSFWLVLSAAEIVETGIETLLLLFWGICLKPVYAALFVGNLLIYYFLFRPLADAVPQIWIAEAVVVGLDGLLVKLISSVEMFRDEPFLPLKWRHAFLIAAVGNVLSYSVGLIGG